MRGIEWSSDELKEFSNKSSETISGFGELMSYYIIGELGKSRGLDFEIKDSREIITTKLQKFKNSQRKGIFTIHYT